MLLCCYFFFLLIMGFNRCWVPGCETKCSQGLILRGFPKREELRSQWLTSLPKNFTITSSSAICEVSWLLFSKFCSIKCKFVLFFRISGVYAFVKCIIVHITSKRISNENEFFCSFTLIQTSSKQRGMTERKNLKRRLCRLFG